MAVTAFSPTTMERRGITNLQDVGKFTPNLELHSTNRPAGGSSAYAAYIRGIGTGDFQFPTDPGVGLYIDDVYMARTVGGLLSIDTDIERIEVIKGPQGALFGRNTIGGAISVITTAPETRGEPFSTALVRFGSYGRKDFAVSVNGPLVQEKLGAKLSVASLHSDGYGERLLTEEKVASEERLVLRGGLRYTPTQPFALRLDGDYSHQDQKPPNGRLIQLRFPPPAPNGMPAPVVTRIENFNTMAVPTLNPGLNLPSNAAFNDRWRSPNAHDGYGMQPVYDRYDLGGGSLTASYDVSSGFGIKSISAVRTMSSEIGVDGDQTPYSLQTSQTALDQTQLSEELQFAGTVWDDRLRYMVGLYVFHESGESEVYTESFHGLFEVMAAPPNAADTLQHFELDSTSLAAFTQETLRIVPGVHVTAGARINRDDKDYTYSLFAPQTMMFRIPLTQASAGWTSFTPKLGIDWQPIDEVLVYASFAQGFKSGAFSASNAPSMPAPPYGPEKVTAYEVGVKTEWLERKLSVMAAGFFNDYRDIQLTVQTVDPMTMGNVRTTQNAGSSKIIGFELELGARPVEALALNLGAGYVDAKFDSLTMPALALGFKLDDRLPQIPDLTVNAGIQYGFELASAGELTLRADVTYKGDQFLTAVDPISYQKGYALIGARVSFVPAAFEALELSLQGLNLSDEVYYIYHANLAPTAEEVAIAGQPRMIYAMAKVSF